MSNVLANTMPVSQFERVAPVVEQGESQDPSILDRMRDSRFGRVMVIGLAATACAAANEVSNGTTEAQAATVPTETKTYTEGNTQVTETSSSTALIGSSKMSAEATAKAKVYGNLRTVSKAKIRKMKKQGKCETFTGKEAIKMGIKTQGYNGSGRGYAYENRKSTFCDSNGDGRYDVRAECGNKAIVRKPQPKKAKSVIWVNNFKKASLKLRSKVAVSARSGCELKTANGRVYADAYGYAESSAAGSIKLRSALKANGKGVKALKTRQVATLTGSLKTTAKAAAYSYCESRGGEVVPPETKDGTQGPGAGTPGQPGGPGAGGQPGNPNEGVTCRDTNDSSNGDMNPNTEGELMYGQAVDQNGYCVGKAEKLN